jgi:hypothetical protein
MNQLTDLKAILYYWNIPIANTTVNLTASNLHSSACAVLLVIIKNKSRI